MKHILLPLVLMLSVFANAQTDPGAILDKVSSTLQSYDAIKADFSFSLENTEADIYDSYEGSLVMQGEKFRLSLMGMLAVSDGKIMWVYMEEFNEANIMDPSDSDFFNPKSIFAIYKDDFNLKYLGKENGKDKIELIPKEENDDYKLLILQTDPAKNQIKEVFYQGLDGNNYVIKIKNMMPNIQLDDRFFIFDKTKHPGVEIFDMR
jgi:outer membrane lipoprotein-sorting protein